MNGQQNILETDILIIGAGPAGISCAIQLLRSGLKVILIEKFKFPRHAPGETLHPGLEPLLESLGIKTEVLKKNFIRHDGVFNISEKGSEFTAYHQQDKWQGFQLFREDFDQLLVNEAVNLGMQFITDCAPQSIKLDDYGNVSDVVTLKNNIRPQYVIDATGRHGWLARRLNISYKHYSPKLISYYGYVVNKDENNYRNPKLYWDKYGWTWIAKVKEDTICWVRLDVLRQEKKSRYWLPEQLLGYQSLGIIRAANVTWRIAEQTSAKNYFFVGDAAFILDPSSSHGVIKAFMSGMMVAHLIVFFKKNDLNHLHNYYNNWIKEWFIKDKEELKKSYINYLMVNENKAENWLREFMDSP